jgi:type I restriction enzyme M protein
LFIDASKDYQDGKKQNLLREQDITKIVATYKDRKELEKYSHLAELEEIAENDYNLNIPRYVDTFEEEEPVDIEATQQEIAQLESELVEVQKEMKGYLQELGY